MVHGCQREAGGEEPRAREGSRAAEMLERREGMRYSKGFLSVCAVSLRQSSHLQGTHYGTVTGLEDSAHLPKWPKEGDGESCMHGGGGEKTSGR